MPGIHMSFSKAGLKRNWRAHHLSKSYSLGALSSEEEMSAADEFGPENCHTFDEPARPTGSIIEVRRDLLDLLTVWACPCWKVMP